MANHIHAKPDYYRNLIDATQKPRRSLYSPRGTRQNFLAGCTKLREAAEEALANPQAHSAQVVGQHAVAALRRHFVQDLVDQFECQESRIPLRNLANTRGRLARFAEQHPHLQGLNATRIHLNQRAVDYLLEDHSTRSFQEGFSLLTDTNHHFASRIGMNTRHFSLSFGDLRSAHKPTLTLIPEEVLFLGAHIAFGVDRPMQLELFTDLSTSDEYIELAMRDTRPVCTADHDLDDVDTLDRVDPYFAALHDLDHWLIAARIPNLKRARIVKFLRCFAESSAPITRTDNFKDVVGFYLDLPMPPRRSGVLHREYTSLFDYLLRFYIIADLMSPSDDKPKIEEVKELAIAARAQAIHIYEGDPDRGTVLRTLDAFIGDASFGKRKPSAGLHLPTN